MLLRVFFGFIILVLGYLSYQLFDIYTMRQAMMSAPAERSFGPEDADLTVVEFVDYACGFCHDIHPIIMEAVERDGNVQLIPRAVPSSNGSGTAGAYLAEAAVHQNKYREVHNYLLQGEVKALMNEKDLRNVTDDLGLDYDKTYEDINTVETLEKVRNNDRMMAKSGFFATPSFMIGKNLQYTPAEKMPSVEDFLKLFEEARATQ